jgi:hypothetical protein
VPAVDIERDFIAPTINMAQNHQKPLPGIFKQTMTDLKKDLTAEQARDFGFATFEDLQETISSLQTKHILDKANRNLNRIKPFLEAIKQWGKAIEVFVNASDMLAFVWVRTSRLWNPIARLPTDDRVQRVRSSFSCWLFAN